MVYSPVVLKFGGSSVAEVKHWDTIAARLKYQVENNHQPILVLSALKDVSNSLESILHLALIGNFQQTVDELLIRHIGFAKQLKLSLEKELTIWIKQLEGFCQEIEQQQHITPKIHAQVLAIGELLSTTIGAAYLARSGLSVIWTDVRQLLLATKQKDEWHHYTSATCQYEGKPRMTEQLWSGNRDKKTVIVTQGFIAADSEGDTVLLGREGSDTSAAYMAALVGAKCLEIWTDVPGIFSSNPKEVEKAKQIPELTYKQAYLMARFGAKVLHPKVIEPAESNGISIFVKSTWDPKHSGTVIDEKRSNRNDVVAVVAETRITWLVLPLNTQSSYELRVLDRLSEMGFDQLHIQELNGELNCLLKYTNSDLPAPSAQKLVEIFDGKIGAIESEGILLSVIGNTSSHNWQSKAINIVKAIKEPNVVTNIDNDCLSFYFIEKKPVQLINAVHNQLLET